jgi:hypothetical protein
MTNALAKLETARLALRDARTLPDVKRIRDIAEAARVYAKAANVGREAQNYAGEIALLAACKAGEILEQLAKGKTGPKKLSAKAAGNSPYRQTLVDTNTPERTAQHWQKMAAIPEKKRAAYIAEVKESPTGEVTAAGFLKAAKPVAKSSPKAEAPRLEQIFQFACKLYWSVPPEIREAEIRELADKLLDMMRLEPAVEPPVDSLLTTRTGLLVARGYTRIVHGGRGNYYEFSEEQILLENFHFEDKRHIYFKEYRSNDSSNVMLYHQLRTVAYADYKVGMFYIAPADIRPTEEPA